MRFHQDRVIRTDLEADGTLAASRATDAQKSKASGAIKTRDQIMAKGVAADDRYDERPHRLLAVLVLLLCLAALYSTSTLAQGGVVGGVGGGRVGVFPPGPVLPPPAVPPQFDLTGFIQEATLDSTGTICQASDPRLAGGTLKVNDIQVIVPCNTILQMPAATLTWQELFSLAPRDIGLPLDDMGIPTQTGLALTDTVKSPVLTPYNGPLPSYEVHVQGNLVEGKYIAGLIFISQQSLNLGQGTITAIDYVNGELLVATSKGPTPVVARVRINDPIGRFGPSHGGPGSGAMLIEPGYDPRFSIDEESPTIHATTGYPMCIPRGGPGDPDCPQANRPRAPECISLPSPFPAFVMPTDGQFCPSFMMDPPGGVGAVCRDGVICRTPTDPTRQVPFEVGDFIDFLGTLKVDAKGAYISAHTVVAHLGIYTFPSSMPAYMGIEVIVQGTSAQPLPNLPQEGTSKIKIEGFSTDPSALVDIYAVDIDPLSGTSSDRWLGTVSPSGPPVIGRFRFRPDAGAFLPPTREVRIVSRSLCGDNFSQCSLANATLASPLPANGLIAGQYHAPNFSFIFPENLMLGDAIVSANFQDLPFLYCGSGPLSTPTAGNNGPLVRQLDPAPWAPPMPTPNFAATLCSGEPTVGALAVTVPDKPPVIKVFPAPTLSVNSGAAVFLSASASDATGIPVAINWVHSGGSPLPAPPMVPAGQPNAITFNAPVGPTEGIFTVIATNPMTGLSSTSSVTVSVTGRASDNVVITNAAWTSSRQNRGALTVVATTDAALDANGQPPADLQLYVQASATVASLVPDGNGFLNTVMSAVQLSATPLSMFYGDTGNPQVCPAGLARCWQFVTRGALVDPNGAGVFVPPDSIIVTSSYGGSNALTGGAITLK